MPGHATVVCPDGFTYDVRDNSPYVKDCICRLDSIETAKFQACLADPTCKEAYLKRELQAEMYIFAGMGILAIFVVSLLAVMVWKSIK